MAAAPRSVPHDLEERNGRFAQRVHLAEMELGQFEMGHRRFFGRRGSRSIELLEGAVRVVPDGFSS
jgi:hypothetical protein